MLGGLPVLPKANRPPFPGLWQGNVAILVSVRWNYRFTFSGLNSLIVWCQPPRSIGLLEKAVLLGSAPHTQVLPQQGVEDTFRDLRRLAKKGGENGRIRYERLFLKAARSAQSAFPNVHQETLDKDV